MKAVSPLEDEDEAAEDNDESSQGGPAARTDEQVDMEVCRVCGEDPEQRGDYGSAETRSLKTPKLLARSIVEEHNLTHMPYIA